MKTRYHHAYTSRQLLAILTVFYISSCKKFVDIPNPPDKIISAEVFTDDAKASSAVTGIYGSLINGSTGFANGLTTVFAGLSSGELDRFNPSVNEQEFLGSQLSPSNSTVQTFWSSAYQHIYYANACLEGLQKSSGVTVNTKRQLMAECRFIRAFCYFYLVNLFGDVPLVLSTDYHVNSVLPRAAASEIYQQITADLKEAKDGLPVSYITTEKVRPNKWAVASLLARVYLYQMDWQKAEAQADEVINSGLYSPLPSLQTAFLKNSKEAIWQLLPRNGFVPEVSQIIPMASTPRVILPASMIQSLSSGDQRRTRWVDSITYQSVRYYYPGKYKATTGSNTEYYMVFRLAEQYLIRAEARIYLNNLTGATSDINLIRSRAGLAGLSVSLTQAELITALENERKAELFAEWGHRWLDLKRTDRTTALLGPIRPGWQPTDALYPVPLNEILTNPALSQNAGY